VKTNGSIYVAAVFAALVGYFAYQWWFNPNRMVKARLGDIAAALSTPPAESDVNRLARLAQLRTFAAADLHLKAGQNGPELSSKDAVIAAISAIAPPPGGRNVDFVDADVRVNSGDSARAYVTADVTTRDPRTNRQTLDSREVVFSFVRKDGEWLVRDAEVKESATTR
jgi:hypothetical protein